MTDDAAVLVQRIADGIESIELTIRDLRDLQSLSQQEYRSPDNRRTREAVERKFETLIAATLDVSKAILKLEDRPIPNHPQGFTIGAYHPNLDPPLKFGLTAFTDKKVRWA